MVGLGGKGGDCPILSDSLGGWPGGQSATVATYACGAPAAKQRLAFIRCHHTAPHGGEAHL